MQQLKILRVQQNLTQKQLSRKSGVSQPYINELEKGKKTNPSLITVCKLADALGVAVMDLLGEEYSNCECVINLRKGRTNGRFY